ncbi:hypothetical protein [Methylobacterium sp. WL64]|uniref:hypothetical protein n=1 Tax=Methylobacterium sp. WL64 TaxID=2603894 RepID=UPI001FEEC6DB|nr:hypothetical protein [Methylobacterium sp. WL64]
MSYEFPTPNKPTFTVTEHVRRFLIDELDAVTLDVATQTSDGETVPAGTTGTVMAVWGQAEAFEVEFDEPFTGLARVDPSMIRAHQRHE